MISNAQENRRKIVPFLLIIFSYSLLIFLFSKAIEAQPEPIVVETVTEDSGLYDMGLYMFDIADYGKSLIRFRSGQLENGEYQSTFFCIKIEDETYVDPNCATGGQYEVFRIEYITQNYIAPEYANTKIVLNFEEEKDFPNLTLLWDNIPEMLLEESAILTKANADGLIEVVQDSFVLSEN